MDKETIDGVREYYKLPQCVSDDDIKKDLKGSLGEAIVNIGLSAYQFKVSLKDVKTE